MMVMQESITMEQGLCEQGKLNVQKHMEQRRRQADKNAIAMSDLDKEHQTLNKQTSHCIARLIDTNQSHFYTSKLNHVFLGWKAYMDRRRRCC